MITRKDATFAYIDQINELKKHATIHPEPGGGIVSDVTYFRPSVVLMVKLLCHIEAQEQKIEQLLKELGYDGSDKSRKVGSKIS